MTRVRKVLRFVFAAGIPGAANPFVGLELIAGAALMVSLLFPAPKPSPENVVYLCRRVDVHCHELADDARRDAIEALEVGP